MTGLPNLTYRSATIADAPAVTALVRLGYGKWVPVIGREPTPMTQDYTQILAKHRMRLAFDGDTLVAGIEYEAADDHLWIENVVVRPDRQGQGIGKGLLDWAESEAVRLGLPEIRLLTNEAFAANVSLYQRLGYRIDRREPFKAGFTVYLSKAV